MPGLLDILNSDQGRTALGLLAAAGPSAVPQSFGQRLMGGLLQALAMGQQQEDREAQKRMREMQLQQLQSQMAAQKRQQDFLANLPSLQMQGVQSALSGGGGPTVDNAARIPAVDPRAAQLLEAVKAGVMPYGDYLTATRKDNSPLKVSAGEALLDRETYKPIFTNPKEDTTPSAVKEYNYAKSQGYGGSFLDFQLAQRKAGAPSVSVPVNLGQKGFDNTLKLRGDFRSEPIYKAHQDVLSAHAQITAGIKAGTPAGDLAVATKLMKILDPSSVVRESELGMAMAATGLLDRVQNYASMVISGNKLTPQQRKEFQALADQLMAQSSHLYNSKRSEYGAIAQRNGLNVEDVTGAAGAVPNLPSIVKLPGSATPGKQVVRTGTHNGRKVVQYADGTTDYAD